MSARAADTSGAAVVLVDPVLTGTGYLETCDRLGLSSIVVLSQSPSYYDSLPAPMRPTSETVGRAIWHTSVEATQAAVAKLAKGAIAAVVPGFETGVELADELALALGTVGNVHQLTLARRDKALMRDAANRAGVRAPRHRVCTTEAEASAAVAALGLPIVVKNPRGCGSHLVEICTTADEALAAFDQVIRSRNFHGEAIAFVLIEEYLEGPEYVVNLISDRDGPRATDVWLYDRRNFEFARNLYFQCDHLPVQSSAVLEPLARFSERAARAVGIQVGLAHAEIKMTARGPSLVEIAARPSGGRVPWILQRTTGVDLFAESLRTHMGQRSQVRGLLETDRRLRLVWCPQGRAGRIARIHGLPDIAALESLQSSSLAYKEGDTIPVTRDSWTNPFFCVLANRDPAQLERDTQALRSLFRIEVA